MPSERPLDKTRSQTSADKSIRLILAELKNFVLPPGDRKTLLRIGLALSCLVVGKIATVATPLVYGAIVNHISSGNLGLNTLWFLVGGYGLVRLCQELFRELKQVVFVRVAQRAVRSAALSVFQHLHDLSLNFHLNRQTGGLIRAIDRGTKSIDFLLTLVMFEILPIIVEVTFVAAVLWRNFGLSYALVITGTVLVYITITLVMTEWRIRLRSRLNAADEASATHALESLLNYETVKFFNAEPTEVEYYDQALHVYEDAAVRWSSSAALVNFGQGLTIAVGLVVVMGMAGQDIRAGALQVGDFVAVNTFLLQLYLPLGIMGYVYREVRSSLIDMGRMFSLLDETPEVHDRPGAQDLVVSGGEVVFENVAFAYGQSELLKGVSFRVPAGRKVAIVGPSGAGKSTIARLLFRFFDPLEGVIRIDGQDLKSVTQTSVRRAIGVVPQDTVLFNDSIRRNISYGRKEATETEIKEAAHLAALDKLIDSLADRYDTLVGERGLKLSVGERQRIAIARTILKSPAILVLDEATSALDSLTEQDIQQAMEQVSRSCTTLVIAHRLSTVLDADNILVLNNGQVVEQGDHNTLLALGGIYAAMWWRQQRNDEDI